MKPLVSVVMPAHNNGDTVAYALNSVLAQTVNDLEVIVIDDGSTDHTREVVEGIAATDGRVTCLVQPNMERCVARNHGIMASSGEYLSFLDADDYWFPHKLEKQLPVLREHPEVGLLSCNMVTFLKTVEDGHPFPAESDGLILGDYFPEVASYRLKFSSPSWLVPRACLHNVGLYRDLPWLKTWAEDLDLAMRLAARYPVAKIPDVLCGYRCEVGREKQDQVRALTQPYRILRSLIRDGYVERLTQPQRRTIGLTLARHSFLGCLGLGWRMRFPSSLTLGWMTARYLTFVLKG